MNNTNKGDDTRRATLIKVVCQISSGLTVTGAALITKNVKASNSLVTMTCKNRIASADNIFEVLSLGMEKDDLAVITICGEDAEITLRDIVTLLTSTPMRPDIFSRTAA